MYFTFELVMLNVCCWHYRSNLKKKKKPPETWHSSNISSEMPTSIHFIRIHGIQWKIFECKIFNNHNAGYLNIMCVCACHSNSFTIIFTKKLTIEWRIVSHLTQPKSLYVWVCICITLHPTHATMNEHKFVLLKEDYI